MLFLMKEQILSYNEWWERIDKKIEAIVTIVNKSLTNNWTRWQFNLYNVILMETKLKKNKNKCKHEGPPLNLTVSGCKEMI